MSYISTLLCWDVPLAPLQCSSYIFVIVFFYADELPGFEESWRGNAGHQLPGWNQNAGISNGDNSGKQYFISLDFKYYVSVSHLPAQ
jgi:hypothetical protein